MSASTFELAKKHQAFLAANDRPACRRCADGNHLTDGGWQCMKGGFFCSAYGVCDQFRPGQYEQPIRRVP